MGRADQIPEPGDFFTISLFGEPLLATREKSGQINVMSAVCRHRGAIVTEEAKGNCSTFRCVYHHWTYGLDGALLGCPAMMEKTEDFNKAEKWLGAASGGALARFHLGRAPRGGVTRLRTCDAQRGWSGCQDAILAAVSSSGKTGSVGWSESLFMEPSER